MKELLDRIEKLEETLAEKETEIMALKEELENTKQYYQDNYKPLTPYELNGISEKDFV